MGGIASFLFLAPAPFQALHLRAQVLVLSKEHQSSESPVSSSWRRVTWPSLSIVIFIIIIPTVIPPFTLEPRQIGLLVLPQALAMMPCFWSLLSLFSLQEYLLLVKVLFILQSLSNDYLLQKVNPNPSIICLASQLSFLYVSLHLIQMILYDRRTSYCSCQV